MYSQSGSRWSPKIKIFLFEISKVGQIEDGSKIWNVRNQWPGRRQNWYFVQFSKLESAFPFRLWGCSCSKWTNLTGTRGEEPKQPLHSITSNVSNFVRWVLGGTRKFFSILIMGYQNVVFYKNSVCVKFYRNILLLGLLWKSWKLMKIWILLKTFFSRLD